MYKINSHLSKTKRILLVTDENLYSLNLNLSLALKMPLRSISKLTLIRNSSAVLVFHPTTSKDFLIETMKRTELLVYLLNQFDRL